MLQSCENLCKKMRQTQKMLPARILGIPTIAYRLVCLSGCLPSRDIGGGEERLAHLPCTARSVPSPSSLPSFLCVRGLSLSLSKANFIGCYKFRPFQSPNRRRRRRQPTPRASRGGREATGARCGLPSYHRPLPILPFNVTLTQDCSQLGGFKVSVCAI